MLPDTVNSWQYHRNNFQKSSQDDFRNYHLWYLWNNVWHFSVSKNVCLCKLSFKFLFSCPITLLRRNSRVNSSFWFLLWVSLRVLTGGDKRTGWGGNWSSQACQALTCALKGFLLSEKQIPVPAILTCSRWVCSEQCCVQDL